MLCNLKELFKYTGIENGKVRNSVTSCYCNLCLLGGIHGGTEATILKNNAPVTNERSNEDTAELIGVGEVVSADESEQTTMDDE